MNLNLYNTNRPFLIGRTAGERLIRLSNAFLEKPSLYTEIEKYAHYSAHPVYQEEYGQREEIGFIGVISVRGTLYHQETWCSDGMIQMMETVQALDEEEKCLGIVLDMTTPGGEAAGTEAFANVVANAQKPVVGFIRSYCLSAGYAVIAGADYIMADGETAEAGSIGTCIVYVDASEAMKKEGYKRVMIVSDLSPNKNNLNFENPSEKDKAQIREQVLNPLTKWFQGHVKSHRSKVTEEALLGGVSLGNSAIEHGLVDGLGSYEEAIKKVLELS